jgi:PPOX class probable F420-dependent enzyme
MGAMPTSPLPDELREFLAKPNPSVIATLRPDGQPVTVATWYVLDGDRILVNMDAGRKRVEHLRQDPRVSLTVMDTDSWYRHVSIIGRVAELADDSDLSGIDRLSTHYLGNPYGQRDRPRVNAWIEIERWHTWEAGRPMGVESESS